MLFTAPAGKSRTQLTVYISHDGGHKWAAEKVIAEKSGGYSDVAVLPDRTILVLHESPRGLLLERMPAPREEGGK
jgi:hypothetical protein